MTILLNKGPGRKMVLRERARKGRERAEGEALTQRERARRQRDRAEGFLDGSGQNPEPYKKG